MVLWDPTRKAKPSVRMGRKAIIYRIIGKSFSKYAAFLHEKVEFESSVWTNLARKYKAFSGESGSDSFDLRRNNVIGYRARVTISCDPMLLTFGDDCGFGEKNSIGFGMVAYGKGDL